MTGTEPSGPEPQEDDGIGGLENLADFDVFLAVIRPSEASSRRLDRSLYAAKPPHPEDADGGGSADSESQATDAAAASGPSEVQLLQTVRRRKPSVRCIALVNGGADGGPGGSESGAASGLDRDAAVLSLPVRLRGLQRALAAAAGETFEVSGHLYGNTRNRSQPSAYLRLLSPQPTRFVEWLLPTHGPCPCQFDLHRAQACFSAGVIAASHIKIVCPQEADSVASTELLIPNSHRHEGGTLIGVGWIDVTQTTPATEPLDVPLPISGEQRRAATAEEAAHGPCRVLIVASGAARRSLLR